MNQYLKDHSTSKTAFSKMLETSRMQANRLVDLEDTSVNLNTMAKIAEAMARKLELKFV